MDINFKGYRVISNMTSVLDDKGFWHSTYTVKQERTLDGENWENKEVTSEGISEQLDHSMADAITTVVVYLETVQGDLFSVPKEGEEIKQ